MQEFAGGFRKEITKNGCGRLIAATQFSCYIREIKLNTDEKKILNGIYRNYEIIDDGIFYHVAELNWLLENSRSRGGEWRDKEGRFRSVGNIIVEGEDWLRQLSVANHRIEKSLSYLKGKKYIDYIKSDNSYKISVTASGCEIARQLQTRIGRIDLWYQDKKDGIIWLLFTILTSAIVTIVTSIIIGKIQIK